MEEYRNLRIQKDLERDNVCGFAEETNRWEYLWSQGAL